MIRTGEPQSGGIKTDSKEARRAGSVPLPPIINKLLAVRAQTVQRIAEAYQKKSKTRQGPICI